MKNLPLKVGDFVDIIAPGFRCDIKDVKSALKRIKSWGLVPRVPKNLFGPDIICGNSDAARFDQLKRALNSNSKFIWCVRGGYGSIRLLDGLSKMKRPKRSKVVLGYSDITSLHAFLLRKWKWKSLHGPLLDKFGKGGLAPRDETYLKKVLFGEIKNHSYGNLKPLNALAKKAGIVRGELIGGNLTVVSSLIGLPWQFDSSGKILFFEDIGERGYRVDRLLKYFSQVGFFKNVKAIVFGEFIEGLERNGKSLCAPVIKRFANEIKIPVLMGLPTGHGDKQTTLPIGTKAILKKGAKAELYVTY
ncbi:MAG: hypothetical protein A4S09_16675 [Proteobacteria bacterium SG_bin7]|nr:MAG: hypothetical protein A4S09_16675 [Proteobacteria bacterium SG_bin7]